MGSDSDLPTMKDTAKTLDEFNVGYEIKILQYSTNFVFKIS